MKKRESHESNPTLSRRTLLKNAALGASAFYVVNGTSLRRGQAVSRAGTSFWSPAEWRAINAALDYSEHFRAADGESTTSESREG
ncbi:MAG: hypothetical protein ABIH23_05595, partial [bacterium]